MRLMIGERFGRLVVVARAQNKGRALVWDCICDCGAKPAVRARALVWGNSKSCGCLRREMTGLARRSHAQSSTRTYNIWSHMLQRCTNPKTEKWLHYGGRGITVCERWLVAANFLADMGEAPTGTTLDRIDVNGGYEPGNCRWVTQRQQSRNTTRTRYEEMDGVRLPLIEWSERCGMSYSLLYDRLSRGWDFRRAISEPKRG